MLSRIYWRAISFFCQRQLYDYCIFVCGQSECSKFVAVGKVNGRQHLLQFRSVVQHAREEWNVAKIKGARAVLVATFSGEEWGRAGKFENYDNIFEVVRDEQPHKRKGNETEKKRARWNLHNFLFIKELKLIQAGGWSFWYVRYGLHGQREINQVSSRRVLGASSSPRYCTRATWCDSLSRYTVLWSGPHAVWIISRCGNVYIRFERWRQQIYIQSRMYADLKLRPRLLCQSSWELIKRNKNNHQFSFDPIDSERLLRTWTNIFSSKINFSHALRYFKAQG